MRWRSVIVGALVSVIGLGEAAACSSFGEAGPDGGEGEGGGDDATSADGPATRQDGPLPSPDAGYVDADAAREAAPSPCLPTDAGHWICDDFDHGLSAQWVAPGMPSSNPVASIITAADAPSPPSVLSAQRTLAADVSQLAAAQSGSSATLRCELDMRVLQRAPAETLLGMIEIDDLMTDSYFRVELRGGTGGTGNDAVEWYGAVNGAPVTAAKQPHLFTDQWQHLRIQLTVGSGASLEVNVDGDPVVPMNSLPGAAPLAHPGNQAVKIGLQAISGTGAWHVEYDNVFCDAL